MMKGFQEKKDTWKQGGKVVLKEKTSIEVHKGGMEEKSKEEHSEDPREWNENCILLDYKRIRSKKNIATIFLMERIHFKGQRWGIA